MRNEKDTRAYFEKLEEAETNLENEVVKHAQLHQLYPDAGHQKSREVTERKLLAVRAKLALLEWLLDGDSGHIPND
jgi:hypothetical protein